ncbi:MAG: hypothetical protein IKD72_10420 [Clostridia bacterium]|nr:hypothetical protein [Clostridia bacterium]
MPVFLCEGKKTYPAAAAAGFHKPVLSQKAPFTRTPAVPGLRYDSILAPGSDAIARKLHLFSMHRSSAAAEIVQKKKPAAGILHACRCGFDEVMGDFRLAEPILDYESLPYRICLYHLAWFILRGAS